MSVMQTKIYYNYEKMCPVILHAHFSQPVLQFSSLPITLYTLSYICHNILA